MVVLVDGGGLGRMGKRELRVGVVVMVMLVVKT